MCLLSLALCGCATIRRFNPLGSHTLEARRLTQEAEAAIHDSSWDEAETKLVTAIQKAPEDNHARSVLADVLWQRGAQRAAVEQKARAIEISGLQDPYELTELGQMELTTGDLDQALRHADEAIAISPSHSDAWTLRGFVLRAQGKTEEALGAFFRSLSVDSVCPRARMEIARIYQEQKQSQRALAMLGSTPRENVTDCPFFAEVCYLRGVLLSELQRPNDAIEALRLAREHGCNADDLLLHLADAQLASGAHLQARATLADAESEIPEQYRLALNDLKSKAQAQPAILASPGRQTLR